LIHRARFNVSAARLAGIPIAFASGLGTFRVNADEGLRPIVGYLVALFVGTAIVAAVPWLSIGSL